jgi:hypothetical protein
MRRLARDETPFLSVVQLRATTLAWWPDDGNVIPPDTYDHDRSARDETSYPPTQPLSILSFISCGCPFPYKEAFHCFLGGSLGEASGRFIYRLLSLLANNNPSRLSTPSSHRIRDNPFLGQYTLKSQETRKWGVLGDGKW